MQKEIRTMIHLSFSRWMIGIFIIIAWYILCSQTWCLQVQCPKGATDVHKYMPQTLDKLELFQRHQKMKQMRSHHYHLHMMVSHQHVFATMPRSKLYQKLKDVAWQLKQLKSCAPWSNTVEREIKEVKEGASHKLLWSRAPKHSQKNCIELKAYIRSNTAHDIHELDMEVHKTVISGETPDISQLWN